MRCYMCNAILNDWGGGLFGNNGFPLAPLEYPPKQDNPEGHRICDTCNEVNITFRTELDDKGIIRRPSASEHLKNNGVDITKHFKALDDKFNDDFEGFMNRLNIDLNS